MKIRRFSRLFLVCLLFALGLPQSALAQEALTQTFTLPDDSFSFNYPANWLVQDSGFGSLFLANSQAAIDATASGDFQAGLSLNMVVPAISRMSDLPQGINANSSVEEVATLLRADLATETTGSGDSITAVLPITINNRPAFRFDAVNSGENLEVMIIALDTGEAISLLIATAQIGQIAPFEATLLAIVGTMQSQAPQMITPADATSIVYGDSLSATLRQATGDVWTFTGMLGDVVTISMVASFDTYLELHDGNNALLISDDDGGDELNSLIDSYTLPYSGVYMITAKGFGSLHVGENYTISLTKFDASTLRQSGVIEIGETVTSSLSSPTGDVWVFTGTGGETVQITMEASFDNYLELLSATKTQLISDDDSAGNLNARITYTLPSDGQYLIVARSYNSSTTGIYTLQLEALSAVTQGQIEYGELQEATVNSPIGDRWQFTGQAGDVITVAMFGDFDTYLELHDANDTALSSNDDSLGLSSMIDNFTLPTDGQYTIIARGVGGRTGNYALVLVLNR